MERRFIDQKAYQIKLLNRFGDGSPPVEGGSANPDDGPWTIQGYGAVFYNPSDSGTEYELYEGLRERIGIGCFDRCLREKDDCRGLFNHNPDNLLGRCQASTMRLAVDQVGLKYEIDLDDTDIARRVVSACQRGDLTGSSFSFSVRGQKWDKQADGGYVRTLTDVELYDAGPVTYPAYTATTTGMRSVMRSVAGDDEARAALEKYLGELAAVRDQVDTRARCAELGI